MDDLTFQSAKSLARAIREKSVSAREVVEAHLRRIEEVNPVLNAVVQLAAERAESEARELDDALARGELRGPLHGVPITIKDSFDTEGIISTGGTLGRAAFVPERDATPVARLRAAGAVLLGKTNTPELTMAAETDNLVYGRTNNPFDVSRTPGGSSGGAAAIISAGGSPLDLGTDTGGSIRFPSHYCGIAGLKPTTGRVPRTGHIIGYDMGAAQSLTVVGPMARYVEDLELAFPIIAGPDYRDPHMVPMPIGDPGRRGPGRAARGVLHRVAGGVGDAGDGAGGARRGRRSRRGGGDHGGGVAEQCSRTERSACCRSSARTTGPGATGCWSVSAPRGSTPG